jgi:hypothetical protein
MQTAEDFAFDHSNESFLRVYVIKRDGSKVSVGHGPEIANYYFHLFN